MQIEVERLRHRGPTQVDPGLALGLLWIVAVLVVDNSSHAHVAVIPAALHNTATRWLVVVCATAVAVAALALRHRQPLVALFAVVAAVIAAPAVLLLLGPALVALYTVAVTLGWRETAIAAVGRDAMAELHRTLELLRGGDGLAERAPRPVLSDLQQLADQSRGGGLDVELGIKGAVRPLPASFELCAYRVVQEALTNVRRHADAAHATVRLRFDADALEVSIEDDGASPASAGKSAGHGLRGIRERAAMLGGTVSAGPREQGGYRVSAILPYPEPL
ncbi:MAG: sensor histidine kinase [Solirubrobacteraceae bacterium]|jgi:hypothetical protein